MDLLTASARDLQLMMLLAAARLLPDCLAAGGRGPKRGVIVPQYTAPANMSPAEIHYLLTGGADRKTVAAVLAHLAAHKVISFNRAGRISHCLVVRSAIGRDPAGRKFRVGCSGAIGERRRTRRKQAAHPVPATFAGKESFAGGQCGGRIAHQTVAASTSSAT